MNLKGIGDRILMLRRTRGMSQEELADRVGVDQSTISHWESGHHSPDVAQLMRLMEELDASMSDILPGSLIE
jgi:transcriptional regulator with XRE-family HTH domain